METQETKEIEITKEEVEVYRKKLELGIKLGEAYFRLQKNKDFKFLFNEFYFDHEVKRYVGLLADFETNAKPETRKLVEENLIGISRLQEFLRCIPFVAQKSKSELESLENAVQEYEG